MAQTQPAPEKSAPVFMPNMPGRFPRLKRWLLVIVMLIVVLVLLLLAYLIFFSKKSPPTSANESRPTLAANAPKMNAGEVPNFSEPMDFQVNLADGRRYLALTLRLALIDDETYTYLQPRVPILRDIIISTLARETSDQLKTSIGIEQLKKDFLRRLNSGKIFTEEFLKAKKTTQPIEDIYFEKFILQ